MPAGVIAAAAPNRFATAFRMNHYQYVRRRLNLVLLVVVPAFFVTIAFYVFPQQVSPVQLYENGILLNLITTRRNYAGAFQALEAAATVAGLTGVFMILNAMKADRRLAQCGYRPFDLVGARVAQMLVVAVFVSAVTTAATAANFVAGRAKYDGPPPQGSEVLRRDRRADSVIALLGLPIREVTEVKLTARRVGAIFVAVSLGAGIYAAMGVFVGALVKRPMEGSYLMFALPFSDIVLLNMPVFSRAIDKWWIVLTPGYHPARLLEAAAFGERLSMHNIVGALVMLLLVCAAAVGAFHRSVRA